jgi:CubicO group peptidase (beta-lactamase class C family)
MQTDVRTHFTAPVAASDRLAVSVARNGFTPALAAELRARHNYLEGLKAGDVSLYGFLNVAEFLPTAVIHRSGPVVDLQQAPNVDIGRVRAFGEAGEMSLDEYLVHPASRAQGMLVLHRGRIAFERYPGMREYDSHLWMSCGKTAASLIIALLEAEGKVDVDDPIETYLAGFTGTAWQGVTVLDILDMATGLDIEEDETTRADLNSALNRMTLAASRLPNVRGQIERVADVVASAERRRAPGEVLEYSSLTTHVLVSLAETIEQRRWSDIFQARVWSRMTVDGDMLIAVTPDEGTAIVHGLCSTRLRDFGRYGLLYTPSWRKAARDQVVTASYLRTIQNGGRPNLLARSRRRTLLAGMFGGDVPVANSRQWDGIFEDGDLWKAGLCGQGLYVSPGKDLVIAWFSTVVHTDLPVYARAIAQLYADVTPVH